MSLKNCLFLVLGLCLAQQAAAHTPAYFGFLPKVEFSEAAPGASVKRLRSLSFTEVEARSPAAKAGLRAGDEVLEINARAVQAWTDAEFEQLAHSLTPGTRLRLKVRHADGKTARISVVGVKQ